MFNTFALREKHWDLDEKVIISYNTVKVVARFIQPDESKYNFMVKIRVVAYSVKQGMWSTIVPQYATEVGTGTSPLTDALRDLFSDSSLLTMDNFVPEEAQQMLEDFSALADYKKFNICITPREAWETDPCIKIYRDVPIDRLITNLPIKIYNR